MESLLDNLQTDILLLVILFRVAAFENQRWVRSRLSGLRGADENIGALVDLVMPIGTVLWYFFLISYGFDTSIIDALVLFVIPMIATSIYGLIKSDGTYTWIFGSIFTLPLGLYLIYQTSIFGLLN
jgi:hypothetical protein